MVILYLTCADEEEALKISQALIENKLVACVRSMPVSSSYWWDGQINHDKEVLLMIESNEDKFEEINKLVAKLHSYEQYVLTMVEVSKTTPGVVKWLDETLK